MCLSPACQAQGAWKEDVGDVVDGVGGGLVEAETLLGGKETVAFVARPFCQGFLRANADSNSAVGVLLVIVEDVDVVLGCSHQQAGSLDLFNTAFPLTGWCSRYLANQVLEILWGAWLESV